MGNLLTGLNSISRTGGYNSGNQNAYSAGSNTAAALYAGQLVQLSSGVVVAGAANVPNIGTVVGFQWIDAVTGQPVQSQYVPAGTTPGVGVIDGFSGVVVAYINDDPDQIYAIEADAALAATTIGNYVSLTSFTAGNTFTKRSTAQLDSSTANTAQAGLPLQITGYYDLPNNVRTGASPFVTVRMVAPDVKANHA